MAFSTRSPSMTSWNCCDSGIAKRSWTRYCVGFLAVDIGAAYPYPCRRPTASVRIEAQWWVFDVRRVRSPSDELDELDRVALGIADERRTQADRSEGGRRKERSYAASLELRNRVVDTVDLEGE